MVGDKRSTEIGEDPSRRVILVGASNLTRGISTVIDCAHRLWGCPLDVMAALGHGRSYGARSRVLGRSLPSILDSGLWPDLAARPALPTAALVTDIGNDLLYEAPVERIADWVSRTLDELLRHNARVVMTRLPVGNIDRLPEWKFRVLRRLMFPYGRLSFSAIAARAHELDARVTAAAASRGIPVVPLRPEWYGWDPIHLKSRHWPAVWHEILSCWHESPEAEAPPRIDWLRAIYLQSLVPAQRWFLGIEQRGKQPCGRLADGTVLSFY
ncbi:MAG: SGNH/GDSL hydrolase family protein [Planctomycetia bacterium]|nr:SGNH/GDSL hydrolase family protein [Planctomycetia bacterium]